LANVGLNVRGDGRRVNGSLQFPILREAVREGGHIPAGDLISHGVCAGHQSCAGVHDGVLAAEVTQHHGLQNVAGHAPSTAIEEHRAFVQRACEGGRGGDGCHVWNLMDAGPGSA
jgi:hypothetical protein